ncbi:MAG: GIY-YIG nuclease family protein, partial [Balneolaceae bacterium]
SPAGSGEAIPSGESLALRIIYYAYILKSESHGTYYYGSADDVNKRLKQHNAGKVRYTKGRKPWKLHYVEEFESRSEARKREAFFKSIDGYVYLKEKGIT